MRIVVLVKRIAVARENFAVREDGWGIDHDDLQYGIGACDRESLRIALALRDRLGGEVIAVSAADETANAALQYCLDAGVNRAVRIANAAFELPEPFVVARGLAEFITREAPDLVVGGSESADDAHAATVIAVASHLGWPAMSPVSSLDVADGQVTVRTEGSDPRLLVAPLPVVVGIIADEQVIIPPHESVGGVEVVALESLGLTETDVDEYLGASLLRVNMSRVGTDFLPDGASAHSSRRVLVIADASAAEEDVTDRLIGLGTRLAGGDGGSIVVGVVAALPTIAEAKFDPEGVDEIVSIAVDESSEGDPAVLADAVRSLIADAEPHVILCDDDMARAFLPGVASQLKLGYARGVTSLSEVNGDIVLGRLAYGGSCWVEIYFEDKARAVITVRHASSLPLGRATRDTHLQRRRLDIVPAKSAWRRA